VLRVRGAADETSDVIDGSLERRLRSCSNRVELGETVNAFTWPPIDSQVQVAEDSLRRVSGGREVVAVGSGKLSGAKGMMVLTVTPETVTVVGTQLAEEQTDPA
jgi:hypothetical protein